MWEKPRTQAGSSYCYDRNLLYFWHICPVRQIEFNMKFTVEEGDRDRTWHRDIVKKSAQAEGQYTAVLNPATAPLFASYRSLWIKNSWDAWKFTWKSCSNIPSPVAPLSVHFPCNRCRNDRFTMEISVKDKNTTGAPSLQPRIMKRNKSPTNLENLKKRAKAARWFSTKSVFKPWRFRSQPYFGILNRFH